MLDVNEIKEIIPHRYPFLLLDKVTELDAGTGAEGYKNVTINEPFFQGHFPDYPVMPGVLIVEAIAQTGAVALLSCEKYKNKLVFFGGINKAKFRKQVRPGCVLRLETELVKIKGAVGVGVGKAFVEDTLMTEVEFTFVVQ